MYEAIAIVISAVITVGGMALIQYLNCRQRKADSRERLFYEMYHKRLAIYEELVQTLHIMQKSKMELVRMSPGDVQIRFSDYCHELEPLIIRIRMYGSPAVLRTVATLEQDIRAIDLVGVVEKDLSHYVAVFITLIRNSLIEVIRCFLDETGTNFVDKEIAEFLKETVHDKKKNKAAKNHTAPKISGKE